MDQRSKISRFTTQGWADSYSYDEDDEWSSWDGRAMDSLMHSMCREISNWDDIEPSHGYPYMTLWGSRHPIDSSWSKGKEMQMSCLGGSWLTL